MQKFKLGFTLAETLIALAVVGVISAMTIPTLMNNYSKKTQAAAAHKFVSQLEDVLSAHLAEKNAETLWEAKLRSASDVKQLFKDNFRIVTDCGATSTPCFADAYGSISGAAGDVTLFGNAISLSSGASVGLSGLDSSYTSFNSKLDKNVNHRYGRIYFDVNGKKEPNIAGRDLFVGYIFEDGSLEGSPYATPQCKKNNDATNCAPFNNFKDAQIGGVVCGDSNDPIGCLSVLRNNNWVMNY